MEESQMLSLGFRDVCVEQQDYFIGSSDGMLNMDVYDGHCEIANGRTSLKWLWEDLCSNYGVKWSLLPHTRQC